MPDLIEIARVKHFITGCIRTQHVPSAPITEHSPCKSTTAKTKGGGRGRDRAMVSEGGTWRIK